MNGFKQLRYVRLPNVKMTTIRHQSRFFTIQSAFVFTDIVVYHYNRDEEILIPWVSYFV